MPTGYTADVADGKVIDFKDFATHCMRAFGACIHMRDEPFDKKYESRVPSSYYYERFEEAKREFENLEKMSDDDIINEYNKSLKDDIDRNKKYLSEKRIKRKYLEDMLKQVNEWTPPTDDHIKFKEFMVEQLESTIDFDCKEDWTLDEIKTLENKMMDQVDPLKIRQDKFKSISEDIARYRKQIEDEENRCNTANKWVSDLIESL